MSRRKVTASEQRLVLARAGYACEACGGILDETWDIDHRVPRWKGGADHVDNYQVLHAKCHREKTLRESIERCRARQEAARARTRPPLSCTRCERVVSPYFLHRCADP